MATQNPSSAQTCPSASLYDLVTKHWPAAVSSNPVLGGGPEGGSSGGGAAVLEQLAKLRATVVEPNAAWFKNHTFTGAIVFPIGNDTVSPMISVQSPTHSSAQSGLTDPVATSATPVPTGTSSGIANNGNGINGNGGGRFRKLRRRNPQGQIPGGGGTGGGSSAPPPASTSTPSAQLFPARVPRQFVYIYQSEVVVVQYLPPNASAPSTLIPKVSSTSLLDSSHPCNTAKSPWQPYKQPLQNDLASTLVGCTMSSKPAISCFVLNVKPAPDCNVPGNCYGEPATIKTIMQSMSRASAGMPEVGAASPGGDDNGGASRLPVFVWVAAAGGALILVGIVLFVVHRKKASRQQSTSNNRSNSAYAKLTSSRSPASPEPFLLSPPAATAQPASSSSHGPHGLHALSPHKPLPSSLDRAPAVPAAPTQLVVPSAIRPPSHLLAGSSPNTHMILTTQTLETDRSGTSPPPPTDDLLPMLVPATTMASTTTTLEHQADAMPVPLPPHLASPALRLHRTSLLHHRPTRAFVGLSGDLGADLSLQDLVDGWVSVLDLSRAVARSRQVPLAVVGQWVVSVLDGLVVRDAAPAGARASARGMVGWYTGMATRTKAVGLAAGGERADEAFVRSVVVPACGGTAANAVDEDKVRVATAAIVAFVRIKSIRPFAVVCEATPGEDVDVRVMKAEEHSKASLARQAARGGGAASGVAKVKESAFPGVVDLVDGVVLAHVRVGMEERCGKSP